LDFGVHLIEMSIKRLLNEILMTVPHLLRLPYERMSFDYDKEADILYIIFKRPQKAATSEMLKVGILVRYRGKNECVGIIVNHSTPL